MLSSVDGPASVQDPNAEPDGDNEEVSTLVPRKTRPNANPEPSQTPKSKRTGLFSVFSKSRDENGCLPPKRRVSPNSRTPDRFVPLRDPGAPPVDRFHTSKQVHTLSLSERLLRHNAASTDPFVERNRPADGDASSSSPDSSPTTQAAAPGWLFPWVDG